MMAKDTMLIHKDYLVNIFNNDLDMESALYLMSKYQGKGFSIYFPEKIKNNLQSEGYLDAHGLISSKGKRYIEQITETEPTEPEDIKLETDFDIFWEAFPSTDKVHHFPGSRSLKDNKGRCKQEFSKIISEGHKLEDILIGLRNQVDDLKMNSIRENRLTFMKNSLRWLRDKDFLYWKDKNDNTPKFDVDVF
jgi:hypothetical protein